MQKSNAKEEEDTKNGGEVAKKKSTVKQAFKKLFGSLFKKKAKKDLNPGDSIT